MDLLQRTSISKQKTQKVFLSRSGNSSSMETDLHVLGFSVALETVIVHESDCVLMHLWISSIIETV